MCRFGAWKMFVSGESYHKAAGLAPDFHEAVIPHGLVAQSDARYYWFIQLEGRDVTVNITLSVSLWVSTDRNYSLTQNMLDISTLKETWVSLKTHCTHTCMMSLVKGSVSVFSISGASSPLCSWKLLTVTLAR